MDDYKKEIDDYFCRFTFGQFVTVLLLEIVTLFFVFYLGARYGSDLVGGPREEAVHEAGLPPESPKGVDDIVGTPKVDYTYPDVLTSRDGQKGIRVKPSGMTADEYEQQKVNNPTALVPRELPSEEPSSPIAFEKITPNSQTPPPSEATPPTESMIPTEGGPPPPPPKIEKPVKPEAKREAPKSKEKFAIQVASYATEEEAQEALGRWKSKGYSAFVTAAEIPDKGIWYRVRIGKFMTRQEAQGYLSKFKAKEKVPALVVPSNS